MKTVSMCLIFILTLTACGSLPPDSSQPSPTPESPTFSNTVTPSGSQPKILTQQITADSTGQVENFYVTNIDGTNPVQVYSGETVHAASLSPDGRKLAYFVNNGLYILDIESRKTTQLNQEDIGSMYSPIRWSPDGTKLAMECAYSQQESGAVCLFDASTGQIEVLINQNNPDPLCAASARYTSFVMLLDWSRDGSTMAYSCFDIPAQGQKQAFAIFLYDLASKTSKMVLDAVSQDQIHYLSNASISPDKKNLLITASIPPAHATDYITHVFLLEISSGKLTDLTGEPGFDFQAEGWRTDSRSFYVYKITPTGVFTEANLVMDIEGKILTTLDMSGSIIY